MSNPTRRKTKRGILKHINIWLARAQDRARLPPTREPSVPDPKEIAQKLREKFGEDEDEI